MSSALAAFHAQPAQEWTAAALARHVGLSRSALMQRFARLLHMSPIRYLTLWRLQLAAQRLQSSCDSVGSIARDVGYRSEAAFSRAFKRFAGTSPVGWRHAGGGDGQGRPVTGAPEPAEAPRRRKPPATGAARAARL